MSRRTLAHQTTDETRSEGDADEAAAAAAADQVRITNQEYYQLGSISRQSSTASGANSNSGRALHNPDLQDDDRQDPVAGSVLLIMWIGLVVALAGFSLLAFYIWSFFTKVG